MDAEKRRAGQRTINEIDCLLEELEAYPEYKLLVAAIYYERKRAEARTT